jgi:hypothetical protein
MNYTSAGALMSPDKKYRYLLWREWRGTHDPKNWEWFDKGTPHEYGEPKACVFVMLNPSTADGEVDDPTIRRCVGFAKAWNYERLEVVNLFAYRATDPKMLLALRHYDNPEGERNAEMVAEVTARAGIVICAWGAHGSHLGQDETALGWFATKKYYALGTTAKRQPKHPLYLPATAKPVLYRR